MFSKLKKRQKCEILRLFVSALLFAAALLVDHLFLSDDIALFSKMWLFGLLIYLPAFVFAGGKTIAEAASNLTRGQIFDENFLMSIAALAALVLGEFTEGVAVMLFAGIGELFESYATSNARGAIDSLAELCPDKAELLRDGVLVTVPADEVKIGDIFEVGAGRRIALDGVVEEGSASVDCSSLTGESLPVSVGVGDSVGSGTVNLDGRLRIRATAPASESAAARIVATVEDAASGKSKTEAFISRFAAIYTPAVCAAALAVAILPPLLFDGSFKVWIYRALSFLVVSCPCALVISVPLTFFGAVGASAKKGILFKDNSKLETLSKLTTVAFDKTGTLTEGRPTLEHLEICDDYYDDYTEEKLLEFAAAAEYSSIHPLARAIIEYAPAIAAEDVSEIVEHPGLGRTAVYRGHSLALGNEKLMQSVGAKLSETAHEGVGTSVCLAVDGRLVGRIFFADRLKSSSRRAIDSLRMLGIKTVMLSGDSKAVATSVARELSIDAAYGELLPNEKLDALKGLIEKGKTGFVGDGINDSPALARADVGFAMGSGGSDAAIDAADVVISSDDPLRVPDAVRVARKTMRIARENIVFAIGVKLIAIALIGFGVVGMWMAVIADVGVSVVAILNSMRMLSVK